MNFRSEGVRLRVGGLEEILLILLTKLKNRGTILNIRYYL